jgi:hypothetical protein
MELGPASALLVVTGSAVGWAGPGVSVEDMARTQNRVRETKRRRSDVLESMIYEDSVGGRPAIKGHGVAFPLRAD